MYIKIQAYFAETKMSSVEQAKQFWNDWSPWTVTEDAFQKIAEKISFNKKVNILKMNIRAMI